MANLKSLVIGFDSHWFHRNWERRRPPPPIRTILPALTHFWFHGVSEYMEDLIAHIDAPLLDYFRITYSPQLIFDISQLAQFMRRATRFQALNEVHMDFDGFGARVGYSPPTRTGEWTSWKMSCRKLHWQGSSLAQVFTSFFPFVSTVEHLYMYETPYFLPPWQADIENMQWLDIFESFTAVENLYLTEKSASSIAAALQELVGSRMTKVLPTLQNIFLERHEPSRPMLEGIGKFVAARQLSGHLITVSRW